MTQRKAQLEPLYLTGAALTAAATREWLDEIAEILALGLMRLQAPKSSGKSADTGESSLDFSVPESGHPTPVGGECLE